MTDKDENATPPKSPGLREERCDCGNLLFKFTKEAVEVKCRRCKRIHVTPVKKILESDED